MAIDTQDDSANPRRFREYAAECRRLAHVASEKDRAMLVEIAEAWVVCAEEVERDAGRRRKR